jgi:mannose-6-phosphate isomerase
VTSRIQILSPHIRNYDWGSPKVIPNFFGWVASDKPVAEVWLGAHPQGSSLIDGNFPLSSAIQSDPIGCLGESVNERFQGRLPFLMKFLAADRPLSIQVHPNLSQAQAGFAQEVSLGIPLNERNYQDPYDKPEQICAITQMWALAGFRFDTESRALCEKAGLSEIVKEFEGASSGQIFLRILKREIKLDIESLLTRMPDNNDEFRWVRQLKELYPEDQAVLAPLFMNLICLEQGQALSVSAGMAHSYLSGFGIEVMGASDNVIRSGLTQKKIDVTELESIISLQPETPKIQNSIGNSPIQWESEVPYFQLQKHVGSNSKISGPAIVACIEGSVSLITENTQVALARGEFAYVMGDVDASIQGTGSAFFCTTNIGGAK